MENDEKFTNFIERNESNLDNIFKLEFKDQNYKNNLKFISWRDSMIRKFGRNAKLFKCILDNILFYTTNKDCKNYPFYKSTCPCCNQEICFFCYRASSDSYGNGTCCLGRKIYCIFFQDGLRLINPVHPEKDYKPKFKNLLKFYFIPGVNLLFFMAQMHIQLFYKLALKNDMPKTKGDYLLNYEDRYHKNYLTLQIFVVIDAAFSLILTISYLILNLLFILLLTIISLPFKLYPMKYYMGIAYGTLG